MSLLWLKIRVCLPVEQEQLDEQRTREQDLMRELRELKAQIQGGGRKASNPAPTGGGGGLGSEYDRKCQKKFGQDAVYDGKGGCKCRTGYVVEDKKCVPVTPHDEVEELCSVDGPAASCGSGAGDHAQSSGSSSVGGGMKLPPTRGGDMGLGVRASEGTVASRGEQMSDEKKAHQVSSLSTGCSFPPRCAYQFFYSVVFDRGLSSVYLSRLR